MNRKLYEKEKAISEALKALTALFGDKAVKGPIPGRGLAAQDYLEITQGSHIFRVNLITGAVYLPGAPVACRMLPTLKDLRKAGHDRYVKHYPVEGYSYIALPTRELASTIRAFHKHGYIVGGEGCRGNARSIIVNYDTKRVTYYRR